MKKSLAINLIFISIGIIILTGVAWKSIEYITYAILFILLIDCIQLIKNITKTNYKVITSIEIILIIFSMFLGYTYTVLILTILLFDLFEGRIISYINMLISIFILYITSFTYVDIRELMIISLTIIITNLYLYEIKDKLNEEEKYKRLNKVSNINKIVMEKKIDELEKYLDKNNSITILKERNFIAQSFMII